MRTSGNSQNNHRDLARFVSLRKDAREDGKVTPFERRQLAQAFSNLEAGERRLVRREAGPGRKPGAKPKHRDARIFRGQTKRAFSDGQLDRGEIRTLTKAFERMEPKEQARALARLKAKGHDALAGLLKRAV